MRLHCFGGSQRASTEQSKQCLFDESRQRQDLDPLVDPSAALLDFSTVLFAIDISLLDLDMLLLRLLLCAYLLCLDYLFLLPQTIPPLLEIALRAWPL